MKEFNSYFYYCNGFNNYKWANGSGALDKGVTHASHHAYANLHVSLHAHTYICVYVHKQITLCQTLCAAPHCGCHVVWAALPFQCVHRTGGQGDKEIFVSRAQPKPSFLLTS